MLMIELCFRIFYSQWAPTQLALLLQELEEQVDGKLWVSNPLGAYVTY